MEVLVTDPNIQMASEIRELKAENLKLNKRIDKYGSEIKELRQAIEQKDAVIEAKRKENKALKEELDILQNFDKYL